MTDTAITTGQDPTGQQQDPAGQHDEPNPGASGDQAPWEREGETFDPDRAKRLLQNLRQERDGFRAERDSYKTKATEHERSKMTEQQRLETERDEARQERDSARADSTRLRMAIKYKLDEDDLDLLGTGSDEQIEARAKRLAERSGGNASTSTSSNGRPVEQLRGGSNPNQGDEPSPDQIAERVRANR